MEVKAINKRASGQAFEVILKPLSPVSDAAHSLPSPPKKDISLEDIEKKLEAAEDRRKVSNSPVSNGFWVFNMGEKNIVKPFKMNQSVYYFYCAFLVPRSAAAEGFGRKEGAWEGRVAKGHGREQQL